MIAMSESGEEREKGHLKVVECGANRESAHYQERDEKSAHFSFV